MKRKPMIKASVTRAVSKEAIRVLIFVLGIVALSVAYGLGCADPYQEGLAAMKAKEYKKALTQFQELRKLDRNYQKAKEHVKELYFLIGKAAYERKDWSEAIEYLEKVDHEDKVNYVEAKNLLEDALKKREL
jgi:tetratricopeptide (TPR) repeat protein